MCDQYETHRNKTQHRQHHHPFIFKVSLRSILTIPKLDHSLNIKCKMNLVIATDPRPFRAALKLAFIYIYFFVSPPADINIILLANKSIENGSLQANNPDQPTQDISNMKQLIHH